MEGYLNYIDDEVGQFDRPTDFITEWTIEAGQTIALPINIGTNNNFEVNWGDGSPDEQITGELASVPTHTYETAGIYRIRIRGTCPYFCIYYLQDYGYETQMEQLTKIVNWGEIEARSYQFSGATNLTGAIPSPQENTFAYFDDNTAYMFSDTSIDSIPANLFANLPDTVTHFTSTFKGTNITSIPENLFANCTSATSFDSTFKHCDELKSLPSNLFANCTAATDFTETFEDSGLISIPVDLFKNNVNATTFESTFQDLYYIETIPETLFDECINATNFRYTFYNDGELKTGPRLWEKTTPTGIDGTGCYGKCDSLTMTGMSDIWKQEKV